MMTDLVEQQYLLLFIIILTKIKNSVQSFGNKDFIMGLREQNDRKQFSLADLKKLNNFVKKVGIINCSTNNLFV